MDNKKKFLIPNAEIIIFCSDDIITRSGDEDWYDGNQDVGGVDGPEIPH